MKAIDQLLRSKLLRATGISLLLATAASATPYTADFEDGTKSSYATASDTFNGVSWTLTNALVGDLENDWKNGALSIRLRGYQDSAMTMESDKSDGVGSVTFSYRSYGTDSQVPFAVEYSTDSGGTWTQLGDEFTATSEVATFDGLINLAGNIRIQIVCRSTSTGTNHRMNVDDLTLSDPDGTVNLPPALAGTDPLSPANGATEVPFDSEFSMTFSKPVSADTGSIKVYTSSGTLVESVAASSTSIASNVVTFSLTNLLEESTSYYIQVDATAFKDADGGYFAGISDTTTWTFTAMGPDETGPVLVSSMPADGATGVSLDYLITSAEMTFDEFVSRGSGSINLVDTSDESTVESLDVTDDFEVGLFDSGDDNPLLYFTSTLEYGTTYRIDIPAGAFTDELGNPNTAFSWTFTTAAEPVSVSLTTAAAYTQDFSTLQPDGETTTPLLPDGWSLEGAVTTYNSGTDQRAWGEGYSSGLRGNLGENVLGYQHTGSTGVLQEILTLRNATGSTITDLTVSYTGKVERADQGRSPIYTVTVDGIEVTGLQFSTESGSDSDLTASVTGLSIADGAIFQIIWTSDRGLPSGSSKQIGLTNVSVEVGSAALPPAIAGLSVNLADLTDTSTSVTATVNSDNGSSVTQRGIVFAATSVNDTPALGGTGVTSVIDGSPGTGSFTAALTGLTASTSYSVRAFATNSVGTSYTSVVTFSALPTPPQFTGTYTQPFDNYDGSWPVGWTAVSSGGVQTFNDLDWTSSTTNGGFYGGLSDPGLLGYLHTSSTGTLTVTLTLINNTGATIDQLYVGYLGQVSNTTATRVPEWTVSIDGVPVSELFYSTEDGVDKQVSTTLTGLNIPAGSRFTLSWVSDRGLSAGSSKKIGLGEVVVALEAPEPGAGFAEWATTNAGGGAFDADYDGDGVANGLEYFFGETGSSFTTTPSLVDGTITWPMDVNATDVSYAVQTSTDLVTWTDVAASSLDLTTSGFISYTPPTATTAQPKLFVRIMVSQAD
ncbi:Ig-like domain-containing protein [Luteolibacter pohnpeiensis]|uniref:Ig-like domain-containing protein n=1 Tax=Luteolibacter pohnpeiensis TaxID=454153 RepID=A0A934S6U3_9BACT|nr:Ig-like domain-containing protein [Luteolibacter pohnpeiensis]MBK1880797.1 Ig-like domain-containing protein [Luteolibacter pohnpeiensis]